MNEPEMIFLPVVTEWGTFAASYSERGLAGLDFPGRQRNWFAEPAERVRQWHRTTESALRASLGGRPPTTLPPLDFSCGTEFQVLVWKALCSIPPGNTRTYGDIARKLQRPGAARAVGAACAANPIPVLVPCHRVLASNGTLGGFSGGLEWKRKLLRAEGVFPELCL